MHVNPTTDDLVALLRARGQRVTSQRVVILRELRRHGRHASAGEIYSAVHEELPGTSVPTIYATLELLADLGLIRKLDVGVGSTLFDARTDPHEHAVCRRCGRVEDVEGHFDTGAAIRAAGAGGFHAERAEVVVSGLCAECVQAA